MFLGRGFFFIALAAVAVCSAQSLKTTPIAVRVDAGHPTGPYQPRWNYFGADEPNYSYAPNGQQLLRELAQLSTV